MSSVIIGEDLSFAEMGWDLWYITKPSTATDHKHFTKYQLEDSFLQLVAMVTQPLSNSILDITTTTNTNLLVTLKPILESQITFL